MFFRSFLFLYFITQAFNSFAQLTLSQERAVMEQQIASGDYTAALERAITIKTFTEKTQAGQPEHAKSLLDVAVTYYYLNDFVNSEIYINASKDIYVRKPGPQSYEFANALQNESYILLSSNKVENAEKATTQAIAIIETHIQDSTLLLASLYSDLGYLETTLGKIDGAKKSYTKSHVLMNQYGFTNTYQYAYLLNNIASFYHDLSDYHSAKKYYEESLAIHKQLFGADNAEYATVLNNIGILYLDFGYYDNGAQLIDNASVIFKNTKGEESLEYSKSLNDIGNVYEKKADYQKAEACYIKSLSLKKALGQENSVSYWTTTNNLATLYMKLGNYTKAASIQQNLLESIKKNKADHEPAYGNYLNTMATIYQISTEYPKAENYYSQALAFYKSYYGENDVNYSRVLNNLGFLASQQKEPEKALQYYQESLRALEKDTSNNQLSLADTYNNIGELYSSTGDFVHAAPKLQKALLIYERKLGKKHPSYWLTYSNQALLDYRAGNTAKAIQEIRQVLDMYISMVYNNFTFLSETEKLKYWKKMYDNFDFYNSLCVKEYSKYPELVGSMYDYSLVTKSIVFNYTTHLKSKILQSGNKDLISQYTQWEAKKQVLATYYNFTKKQIAEIGIDLTVLENEVNTLEKSIMIQSSSYKIGKEIKNVRWKDIQAKLKDNEAAVQIIRVEVYETTWTESVVYAALILTKETTTAPIIVVLKNGNQLEKKFYKGFSNAVKTNQVTEQYYNEYWKEIDKYLDKKTIIFVSPAGVYNKISLPALKLPDGTYLLEKNSIQVVPQLRNLGLSSLNKKPSKDKAFLFGHPNYNYALAESSDPTLINSNAINRDEMRSYQLNELPGTKIEVDTISQILRTNGFPVSVFTGDGASESEIKKLISPGVLHIATHGYFIKDHELEEQKTSANNYTENPLLRSGILLAGSNYTLSNQSFGNPKDDGILTAYEAMQLNLEKTDLLILSACETGLGDEMNGEGVLGLQRAFMMAGAKNMLMSLWQVSDEGTQLLMRDFYKYWVLEGDTGIAFRKAQLELMKTHPSPYYWAAFVYIK